jgi:predicted nucleotidyltransferase
MIPPFDEHGYLPPGIHPATLDQIAERFGQESEIRRVQMESLRWLIDLARRAGVARIVINGSFVTDAYEPNDVDCVLLLEPKSVRDRTAVEELVDGLPFLQIDLVEQADFDVMVEKVFATDRVFVPKGMIEVNGWD